MKTTMGIDPAERWEVVNMETEPIIRVVDSSPGFHPGYEQTVCKIFRYGAERPTEARALLISQAPAMALELEELRAVNSFLELACRWFLAEGEKEAAKILTQMGWTKEMGIGGQAFVLAYLKSATTARAALAQSTNSKGA